MQGLENIPQLILSVFVERFGHLSPGIVGSQRRLPAQAAPTTANQGAALVCQAGSSQG